MKIKKCKPSRFAVISGERVTYGFRCAQHSIHTKRYSTRELREERLEKHRKEAKKLALALAKSSKSR